MLLFNRRILVLTAALLVAACGFTPVYGPDGTGTALQNTILVDEPQDQNSYWLTQRIEEKLGRATEPRFTLGVEIAIVEQGLAVDPQGDITRYNLLGRAEYALRDANTGDVITFGKETNLTGYSATGTSLVTQTSERDARERLMIILADQIISRLISTTDLPS